MSATKIPTLAEQEEILKKDPVMQRFAESRRTLAADPYRPFYHFVTPESSLNDPNGLCFWQGKWHLFYQTVRPGEREAVWGHTVSDDLIHWRDLPHALLPGPESDACWSGGTVVEKNRVVAMYYAHPRGNMAAVAGDPLLIDWRKVSDRVVIPCATPIWTPATGQETTPELCGKHPPAGTINFIYDACIWKEGRTYYSLSGGALRHGPSGRRVRMPFLFKSRDLVSWKYMHPFVEGDIFGTPGDDFGCPYFWPIGDRHILLHFSHRTGAHYLLGDYDRKRRKFTATSGGDMTFGPAIPASGNVHAPAMVPDGKGGVIAIFNVNESKPTPGWNMIMTLPRRLALLGPDDLAMEPAGDLESLRHAHQRVENLALSGNREVVLDRVQGNAMELALEIDTARAQWVELNVLRSPGREEFTRIAFYRRGGYLNWERGNGWERAREEADSVIVLDTSYSSELPDTYTRAPTPAPVYVPPTENLKLRVFIDRSVVEVFVNGRQCVAGRMCPGRSDSLGVSLRAQGSDAKLVSLDAWQMRSVWQDA